ALRRRGGGPAAVPVVHRPGGGLSRGIPGFGHGTSAPVVGSLGGTAGGADVHVRGGVGGAGRGPTVRERFRRHGTGATLWEGRGGGAPGGGGAPVGRGVRPVPADADPGGPADGESGGAGLDAGQLAVRAPFPRNVRRGRSAAGGHAGSGGGGVDGPDGRGWPGPIPRRLLSCSDARLGSCTGQPVVHRAMLARPVANRPGEGADRTGRGAGAADLGSQAGGVLRIVAG